MSRVFSIHLGGGGDGILLPRVGVCLPPLPTRLSGGWLSEPLDCADFLLGTSPRNDIRRLSDFELRELSTERVDSFSFAAGRVMAGVLASGEVAAAAAVASTGEVILQQQSVRSL